MQPIRVTAFRAAVLFTVVASACDEAPVAPRPSSRQSVRGTPVARQGVEVFSGRRADSVLSLLETGWAQRGHPEYRQTRVAWRKHNGVPATIGDPGLGGPVLAPNADGVIGRDPYAPRPSPKIISHYESLHFGYKNQYVNAPDAVEAEVTFVGDQASMMLNNLSIVGKDGSNFSAAGALGGGGGQSVNCPDVIFGDCENRRHNNAVMMLWGAPICDAHGNGSVSYYVTNLNSTVGVTAGPVSGGATGGPGAAAAGNASIDQTAPACPPPDTTAQKPSVPRDTTNTGDTGGSPTGGAIPPPAAPTGPGLPPVPPPAQPTGPGKTFWCEQVNVYTFVNGVQTLFDSSLECYPET